MTNYRERLTANANDFDSIVSEMLAENERLRDEVERKDGLIKIAYKETNMAIVEKRICPKHGDAWHTNSICSMCAHEEAEERAFNTREAWANMSIDEKLDYLFERVMEADL